MFDALIASSMFSKRIGIIGVCVSVVLSLSVFIVFMTL